MGKKLISLILVLPLILMISLFTTVNTVSLTVAVPVSKIEILGSKIVYLDLDKQEKHFIDYAVYPTEASNQKIEFSTEQIGTARLAELEYKDGYICPKSVGQAKVYLTTADGGFKDSLIVQVDASSLQAIECEVEKSELIVREKTLIKTEFIPANAADKLLHYVSDNENVATVNERGEISAVGKGVATITVSSETNPSVFDTVQVKVDNEEILELGQTSVSTWQSEGTLDVSVDTIDSYELSYKTLVNGIEQSDALIEASFDEADANGHLLFRYAFREDFYGEVRVVITITTPMQTLTKECVIERVNEITAEFISNEPLSYEVGTPFRLHLEINVKPTGADVSYEVETSNDNLRIDEQGNRIRLTAILPGVTTVTVRVKSNQLSTQIAELTREIVVLPSALTVAETANTYGIEDIWTIGKTEVAGYSESGITLQDSAYALHLSYGKTAAGEGFTQYLSFETDTDKVRVNSTNGVISMDEDFAGLVKITAKFSYRGIEKRSEPFTIRCVGNAVNVDTFYDLYQATKERKPVVLQGDIKEDFGYNAAGGLVYTENTVTKIQSTYDTTWYKNVGNDNPTVKVLLEFKSNVYGNGHQINAHNVAYALDSAGQLKDDALFRGPLNFVAMSESNSSSISVKAQDNICYALYEGVTVNNVELRACDLLADSDGNYDLNDLNYVGTTVEVLGDNVNIEYSRITNGRTVLRAFGDIANSSKVIHVNIQNSVLSGAREFILRIGSNAFVDGTKENPSPYINASDSIEFPVQKAYKEDSFDKSAYDKKYIKTFVNVKNSVMKDAGIFCVGMDAHFSGGALADGSGFLGGLLTGWNDLAKTSYGAKLTFEGDVRMYDWKDVESVDSSTLIEIMGESNYKDSISFNVKELIQEIAKTEHLKTIVHNENGKQYVHGGIAFFGGGKNYSVFEGKGYSFHSLNGYEVKLSDVGKTELQLAAGDESFYFLLHDSTTANFLPKRQEEILGSGKAYDCIYVK